MQVSRRCGHCGAALRPGARFCPECGYAQQAGTPKTQAIGHAVPRLKVLLPNQAEQEITLSNRPVRIGRAPDNDIVVPFETVSRRHARIVPVQGGYAVTDLGSANGTYLQGQRIPPNQPTLISGGQVIRIGDQLGNSVRITYLTGGSAPILTIRNIGPFPIPRGQPRVRIGRAGCDINLPHPTVSHFHAELIPSGSTHRIRDLNSTNGTFVNGKRVKNAVLQTGWQIKIGPYRLTYQGDALVGESSVGNIRLDGVNLFKSYRVPVRPAKGGNALQQTGARIFPKKREKIILDSISLTVMPREFIALVGGSGAGKSTLMDALNGFRRAHKGQVLVNGNDLYKNFDQYRTNLGYVPQQDIIHTGLTVQRALWYAAKLRLPPDTPNSEIENRIKKVLRDVDMVRQLDQQISSLSGGQRKRVSIASELISDPSLFFLDEPTSGLDPGLDKKMMSTLRVLADGGRTIVLTTHATNNIIGQCDHVCFLSFGKMVYYGPPKQAMQFFQAQDFADIYSKLNTENDAARYQQQYHTSPEYQQFVVNRQQNIPAAQQAVPQTTSQPGSRFGPLKFDGGTILRQFGILSRRYLDLIFNDRFSLFILLAVMPIIGVLLLLIANGKCLVGDSSKQIDQMLKTDGHYNIVGAAQKLLLMMALPAFLLGIFASAYEIIKEKAVYRRERMINLSIPAYLGSKVGVLMGFGLFQSAMLMWVVSWKVEYPSDGVFLPATWEVYISLVLALLAGIAMGLLISAMVKSSNTVIYLILVVLIVQIIFSGALFDLPDAAGWISVITPTRWALEGLGASVNMERLNDLGQSYIEEIEINGRETEVNEIIDAPIDFNVNYERAAAHLLGTWAMQIALAVGSLVLAGYILKRQDTQT